MRKASSKRQQADTAAPGGLPSNSRELKGLHKRGRPILDDSTNGSHLGRRTRSGSCPPPVRNSQATQSGSENESQDHKKPPQISTSGDLGEPSMEETGGQQLTDQAVAGLAKALGRRQKKVAKQASKSRLGGQAKAAPRTDGGEPASPFAAKSKGTEATREEAKPVGANGFAAPENGANGVSEDKNGDPCERDQKQKLQGSSKGKGAKQGPKTGQKEDKGKQTAAQAAPKRVRRVPPEVEGEVLGPESSDSGSDWEPDWASGDDQNAAQASQDDAVESMDSGEEEALQTEDVEPGLLALRDSENIDGIQITVPATGSKDSGKKNKKKASDPDGEPAGGNKRRKGKKKKEEEEPNTDDEIWKQYDSDADLDAPYVPKEMEQMEAPPELLMTLLPYQKEFLAWAVTQEQGNIKGGILADEMGMGKTIQAISVIVAHRTDDNSTLPSLLPMAQHQQPTEVDKGPKRLKLRLQNAPTNDAAVPRPGGDSAAMDKDDWEDVPTTPNKNSLQPAPSTRIHKADTVVPDLVKDNAGVSPSGLAEAPSVKAPESEIPEKDRPPRVHTVMAVGDSCCGKNNNAATAPQGNFCRATLVICPLVAVIQWRQEIARFTAPGALKVVVYHGNKRATSAEELENADVVLTTYSIVEGEFRRHTQPNKATCTYCNKKFYPDRLKVHLRFFCGPNAKKSDALAKQQKKRPRAGGAQQEDESDFEDELDSDEDLKGKKGKKGAKSVSAKKKGKGGKEKAAAEPEDKALGKGKGKAKGKEKQLSKGKGKAKASPGPTEKTSKSPALLKKPKRRKKKAESDDSDPEFSMDEEAVPESSEGESDEAEDNSGGEGPSSGRIRPTRIRNDALWESKAMQEAERMIAAAEDKNKKEADVGQSLLHQVRWRRIILDEAHSIKDRRSSTAKAIFALDSKYKWALSGTPLQNRVSELYSLVRFLRIFPYAYYFCNTGRSKSSKKANKEPCTCKSLDYSFKTNWRKCDHCGHSPLHHYCYWNKWVANPIKKFGYVGRGRSAMRLLKTEILEKILLRRTKVQCADVLALPPRTVILRKDRFDEREEDFYEALYTQSQAQFDSYVQTSTVLNNYAHVFSLLVRLRQAVNHPYLVVHSANAPSVPGAATAHQRGNCTICRDPLEDGIAAGCGHAFCRACITEYMETSAGTATCVACDRPLTIDLVNAPPAVTSRVAGSSKDSIVNRISLTNFQSSTKIEALREELDRMLQRDPSGKAIVFSQFTSMLDLIAFRLQQVGVKCVRLEGSMAMEQRDRMIAAFTNDPAVKVFLMSLKAGGVALNLTAASHVMLMDPWWNPAVEQQAQDRIHRLGQFKPIHVTRFVIGGTIEERILKLQEKKQAVFEGTVGRDAEALGRLSEDDLRFLFG